ncbi:ATP synthase F1 subunit delta [Niastella yeongjuensis]|uniref:ATP synthase subunit delta n=1 Tax=Niastella yeongjuensis TaxID=354355 RepID=A0A1V9EXW5_9BACT|nr:ATP synthase F1 subunit delta [Niastella yeongjuensis]OQP50949.1 ATP synthase F1 subunit delta [Niastella yeongjuensis]SEN10012.1 F-type H+-transporting ATPase subunit delta [Niastella yeongjuensis]
MPNPRLAARYAKSLIDLANEKNQVEPVYKDMLFLQALCKDSRDFLNLLRSPVVKADKKVAIVEAVTKGKISELTNVFNRLLINKGRESNLPEVITSFIDQYKQQKGIHTVKLTTAVPVTEEMKKQIIGQVQKQTKMDNIDLKTTVNEEIIGGFVLEIGDQLIDASVVYDLNKIKAQFMNNDFIYKIR